MSRELWGRWQRVTDDKKGDNLVDEKEDEEKEKPNTGADNKSTTSTETQLGLLITSHQRQTSLFSLSCLLDWCQCAATDEVVLSESWAVLSVVTEPLVVDIAVVCAFTVSMTLDDSDSSSHDVDGADDERCGRWWCWWGMCFCCWLWLTTGGRGRIWLLKMECPCCPLIRWKYHLVCHWFMESSPPSFFSSASLSFYILSPAIFPESFFSLLQSFSFLLSSLLHLLRFVRFLITQP